MTGPADDPRWIPAWSEREGVAAVHDVMHSAWGVEPDVVRSAPGRLTIVGDFTDAARGLSLATVIPHRTFVGVRRRSDNRLRIASLRAHEVPGPDGPWEGDLHDLADLGADPGWVGIPAGVTWAFLERGFEGPGLDIAIASCIPPLVGLASSSSVAVATAHAINEAWGLALGADETSLNEMVDVCVDGQNGPGRGATAGMSEQVALRCPEGETLLLDFATRPPEVTPYPLAFPEYGLGLLVVVVGHPRAGLTDLVRSRIDDTLDAAAALGIDALRDLMDDSSAMARLEGLSDERLKRRARHVVTENERVMVVRSELAGTAPAHERFVAVGKALFRSHASMELDLDMEYPEVSVTVDTAFREGALGARMVASGGGGSVVVLVRRHQARAMAGRIADALCGQRYDAPAFFMV